MKSTLSHITASLSNLHSPLRADIVVAELMEPDVLDVDEVLVRYRSDFKRAYDSDILNFKETIGENSNFLEIDLSRSGIYDRLPEGIFHHPTKSENTTSYLTYRRQQKEEQENARLLFAPIENAFFKSEVEIEKNRKSQIEDILSLKNNFLFDFWGLPKDFPEKFAAPFMRLLPYAKELSGNLDDTFYVLELLLGIKVTYKYAYQAIEKVEEKVENITLGLNFILEKTDTIRSGYKAEIDKFLDFDTANETDDFPELTQPSLEVLLQPEKQEGIPQYIEEDGLLKIAKVFYDYFIPMEYKITTKISSVIESDFVLGDKRGTYLGMSTKLGS